VVLTSGGDGSHDDSKSGEGGGVVRSPIQMRGRGEKRGCAHMSSCAKKWARGGKGGGGGDRRIL
jgi:hypothetical protein